MKWKTVFVLALCTMLSLSYVIFQFSSDTSADGELIRFHVIANSDRAEDQKVKLEVRDQILTAYKKDMTCLNYHEAHQFLLNHQTEIKKIAEKTLADNGFPYGADVVIGNDDFPTKSYGALTLAAGEYESLKVILGNGEGKNWWCVLFPPLCFVDVTQNIGVAKYEVTDGGTNNDIVAADTPVTEVKMKSKLWELIQ